MSESNVSSEVKEVNNQEMQEKLAQKVEVTMGDIQVLVNIIDVATQRGAFRAPELKGVGEYYEKMAQILSPQKE
tara:strand:- start:100 stop:321 length:222 start_codon:yes stop_codon:yes gene_type:complete